MPKKTTPRPVKPSAPSSNGGLISTENLLVERGSTHGNFTDNSRISQALKEVIRNDDGSLNEHQREALDMIVHKIGRILAGNPNFADHWDDIAGYAKLVSQRVGEGK